MGISYTFGKKYPQSAFKLWMSKRNDKTHSIITLICAKKRRRKKMEKENKKRTDWKANEK